MKMYHLICKKIFLIILKIINKSSYEKSFFHPTITVKSGNFKNVEDKHLMNLVLRSGMIFNSDNLEPPFLLNISLFVSSYISYCVLNSCSSLHDLLTSIWGQYKNVLQPLSAGYPTTLVLPQTEILQL